MSIWTTIVDFFKNVFFPKFKAFLKSVFTKAVSTAMAEIQEIVQQVVAEVALTDLTNSEKRAEAYRKVVAILKASGLEVSESIIRSTIELAVLALKNEETEGTVVNE